MFDYQRVTWLVYAIEMAIEIVSAQISPDSSSRFQITFFPRDFSHVKTIKTHHVSAAWADPEAPTRGFPWPEVPLVIFGWFSWELGKP